MRERLGCALALQWVSTSLEAYSTQPNSGRVSPDMAGLGPILCPIRPEFGPEFDKFGPASANIWRDLPKLVDFGRHVLANFGPNSAK